MMPDKFNAFFEPLWIFLHRGHVIRRIVLGVAIWITIDSYNWAKWYAMQPDASDFIYAAVLGVPSALMATAVKFYTDGRKDTK